MLKGILSLFTSGVILSPFVLFGIVAGSYCYCSMELVEIQNLLIKKEFYAVVALASAVFVYLFGKVYHNGGTYLNWSAMFWRIIANIAKFFVSFVLVMSFISMISIF